MEDKSNNPGHSENKQGNFPVGKEDVNTDETGISDPGIEWSDENDLNAGNRQVLGEKADKYIKEIADPEDMPDEEDVQQADAVMNDED
jgi:hypothetical protein